MVGRFSEQSHRRHQSRRRQPQTAKRILRKERTPPGHAAVAEFLRRNGDPALVAGKIEGAVNGSDFAAETLKTNGHLSDIEEKTASKHARMGMSLQEVLELG